MKETSALLLAAGLGTRLRPYTDDWPKCLMPIKGHPLLEYWLSSLHKVEVKNVLVNLHYHADVVRNFLNRPQYENWVETAYEADLLGTAGTLRAHSDYFKNKSILLVHADNLCCCDLGNFIHFHHYSRPAGTVMTMMTFESQNPSSCGIVELDSLGVVQGFHEKVKKPPGKLANAAVYILEPEVLDWIVNHPKVTDISTELLPCLIGKIATWQNNGTHRDIGTIEELKEAQNDYCEGATFYEDDEWQTNFNNHPIHKQIKA